MFCLENNFWLRAEGPGFLSPGSERSADPGLRSPPYFSALKVRVDSQLKEDQHLQRGIKVVSIMSQGRASLAPGLN